MKLHGNAKLSVKGRELLVERIAHAGWSLTQAAEAAGVSGRTARKWLARHRAEGVDGLLDRSSAPSTVANRTDESRIEVITTLQATARAGVHLEAGDFDSFASALSGLTLSQARQALAQVAIEDGELTAKDLGRVIALKAQALRDGSTLEYFPAASSADQLGGFANFQRWLERARLAFSEQAAELNIPAPKGVRAEPAARPGHRRVDGSGCPLDRRDREGLAPSGNQDADGGLCRRLFGSFLTWLQEKEADVFVVATANDLSVLPPELLRKGRFDEIFFVDLPDAQERATILRIHLRLRKQDPAQFDIECIAAAAEGFSGAELEQVISASLLRALQDRQPLSTDLVVRELSATVPLSRSRAEDVERLRVLARERFVPVK